MNKTITITVTINTDRRPMECYGIRHDFIQSPWHKPEFMTNGDEIGCLDAPRWIPAGGCFKVFGADRFYVYDSVTLRGM
jgi:hypothetical protein